MKGDEFSPVPWHTWEDYQHGLYTVTFTPDDITASAALLADPDQFLEVAAEMVREWPVAAFHNLTNMPTSRNAWVGQASCLYAHGAPAVATRQAWGLLSDAQRRDANKVAETIRVRWEQNAEALF